MTISRAVLFITFLLSSLFFTTILPKKAEGQNVKQKNQRNVLLIISDDQGISELESYGNKKIKTPNLDKMAKEGVRFTNAFAVSASCSASRGTILTGLFPHQNGQYGHEQGWNHFSLFDKVETIPSILKKEGYKTGLIGKLDVGSKNNLKFDFVVTSNQIMGNRNVKKIAKYATQFFNEEKDTPFFLLIGFSDPHRQPSGKAISGKAENYSGFGNNKTYPGITPTIYKPEDVIVPDFLPDIPVVREELAEQYQAITRMDQGVGWILDGLKKSGRFGQTLIIYTSDNGIPFPGAKTNLYDSGLHLPWLVISPTVKNKGNVNNALISFADLMPTILDWTKGKLPKYKLPGKSFLNILDKKDDESRKEVFGSSTFHSITMYYPMRSIRTKKYQYILNLFPELDFPFATDLYASKTWQAILKNKIQKMGKRKTYNYLYRPKEELYDIIKDPAESINLVNDPKYSKVLKDLRNRLQKMREKTKDPWLINDNYKMNHEVFPRK